MTPFPPAPVAAELVPFTLIDPAIVTAPLTNNTTGVLVTFFLNVTVTPDGTLMLV
jgi:hypothetical protein